MKTITKTKYQKVMASILAPMIGFSMAISSVLPVMAQTTTLESREEARVKDLIYLAEQATYEGTTPEVQKLILENIKFSLSLLSLQEQQILVRRLVDELPRIQKDGAERVGDMRLSIRYGLAIAMLSSLFILNKSKDVKQAAVATAVSASIYSVFFLVVTPKIDESIRANIVELRKQLIELEFEIKNQIRLEQMK